MSAAPPRTVILGVGNEFRGDDGAGRAVARLLRSQLPPEISIHEATGEGTALMDSWRGAARVILVDAVCSGATPGTVYRIDASSAPLATPLFPCSTHGFGVADAIETARALHELPDQVVLFGIEGGCFDEKQGLSEEVQRSVIALCQQIVSELSSPSGPGLPDPL
jgi:hydrogenase maturation protease